MSRAKLCATQSVSDGHIQAYDASDRSQYKCSAVLPYLPFGPEDLLEVLPKLGKSFAQRLPAHDD